MTATATISPHGPISSTSNGCPRAYANKLAEATCIVSIGLFSGDSTISGFEWTSRENGTFSGPATSFYEQPGQSTGQAILEIRRRTGLTWELLGEIFKVSRRTVHHWASGKNPTSQNERDIRSALDAIRHLDDGSQRATHDRLMTRIGGRFSPFELLTARCYADLFGQPAGKGSFRPSGNPNVLSIDEKMRRRPLSPALRLDAIQDRPAIPATSPRFAHPFNRKKQART